MKIISFFEVIVYARSFNVHTKYSLTRILSQKECNILISSIKIKMICIFSLVLLLAG